ncbi:uncharacterized protein RJT21DRAFT_115382 [Scheffersomyces amazonensis]|uniref:uncharacterized protein n=1 Tax=Scheffersomyces amazonensis TaxID=1078765 RepID=UPI00315DD931
MAGETYFITGANRGIGFEITKYYSNLSKDNKIVATARDPSKAAELKELAAKNGNIEIIPLAIDNDESVAAIDSELTKIGVDGIDIYVANAAISDSYYTVLDCPKDVWLNHYTVNSLAPILVLQKLHKYLLKKQTRKIAFISSGIGSLTQYIPTPISAYGQSKAALNFSVIELSHELKPEGFNVVAISPGVVSTDMGAYGRENILKQSPQLAESLDSISLTPEQSGSQVAKLIDSINGEVNGKFLNYDGTEIAY